MQHKAPSVDAAVDQLEEGLSAKTNQAASASARISTTGPGVPVPPPSRPLPPDIESDNDLKHAAYCVAEICYANEIAYPPVFRWPNPRHDSGGANDVVTIPPLVTHPKLSYQNGRYVAYRTAAAQVSPSVNSSGRGSVA